MNIGRILRYRLGIRLGIHPVRRLWAAVPPPPFFHAHGRQVPDLPSLDRRPAHQEYFGWLKESLGKDPPDWFRNPLTNTRFPAPDRPWWAIQDFDPAVGDIKTIWEASRMEWAPAWASATDDPQSIERLNAWLEDWCLKNPPYQGPNWKCGQEASIRVMHLALAAWISGQMRDAEPGLLQLISVHLQRVAPTLPYALAQDNNHGTSEAAALFIGGSWLRSTGADARGARWERMGRRWLENRVRRLVLSDGTFSQYSVNYHRVLLDTTSIVELWRRALELPVFSSAYTDRVGRATAWLHAFTDPATGDAPNLGSNDGARLFSFCRAAFRDYRPSVNLAAMLRGYRPPFADVPILLNETLPASGLDMPKPGTRNFPAGGFARMEAGSAVLFFRYPVFRFRPHHADVLHLDLWVRSNNLLRDAGSLSYAMDLAEFMFYSGVAGHNTVQFDGRDQMPRLGRFLYGAWPRGRIIAPLEVKDGVAGMSVEYRDWRHARHRRTIQLFPHRLVVEDEVSGFSKSAVWRWRLSPGPWAAEGLNIRGAGVHMNVRSSSPVARAELVSGRESRLYLRESAVPLWELELRQHGTLSTEIIWDDEAPRGDDDRRGNVGLRP